MDSKRKGAHVFVETLKSFGIEYIFSVPGTTLLDIYDVLREESTPRLIIARHEQAAAMMADGYARVSGKPGIVLVSRGPALCNTAIGLHGAYVESSSIVVVNGSPPKDISFRDCFEEMDFAAFAKPLSKWYIKMDVPSRIEELTVRALRESLSGRPRPVVVSFPIDVQQAEIPEEKGVGGKRNEGDFYIARPSETALRAAVGLFEKSEKPVFLLGGGCRSIENRDDIVKTAELLHAPVVATWGRTDVFPNSHPLYAGMAGPGAFQITNKVLKQADTVLAAGCRFSEFTTNRYKCFSEGMKLVHVDIDPSEIGKIFPAEAGIQSDSGAFFHDFREILEKGSKTSRGRSWAEETSKTFAGEKIETRNASASRPRMRYTEIFKKLMPEDALFVIDCATYGPWLTRYYGFDHPQSVMISASGCLGFGFPAGLGAALAVPKRKVVSVVGDGSFLMCLPNLATAVQEKIPLIVTVMNNCCYGNIAERQKAYFDGRIFGCELQNPNFAQVAEEFGARGYRVHNPEEFEPALANALSREEPCVIDVIEDFEAGLPWGTQPLVAK